MTSQIHFIIREDTFRLPFTVRLIQIKVVGNVQWFSFWHDHVIFLVLDTGIVHLATCVFFSGFLNLPFFLFFIALFFVLQLSIFIIPTEFTFLVFQLFLRLGLLFIRVGRLLCLILPKLFIHCRRIRVINCSSSFVYFITLFVTVLFLFVPIWTIFQCTIKIVLHLHTMLISICLRLICLGFILFCKVGEVFIVFDFIADVSLSFAFSETHSITLRRPTFLF